MTFEELIDPAERLVRLGSGYEFTEGPVWSPLDGCLYFCDLPGDTRWRWSESDGMQVALRPAFKSGGLSMDADGNLVACEHVGSCRRALRARWPARRPRLPPPRRVPQQPQRHRRARQRRQRVLHRSRLRPLERLGRRRAQPRPLPRRVPHPAGRWRGGGAARRRGRVRRAERDLLLTGRVRAVRQRLPARPRQGVRRRAGRHVVRRPRSSWRGSARGLAPTSRTAPTRRRSTRRCTTPVPSTGCAATSSATSG